jgi:hypothetical protein
MDHKRAPCRDAAIRGATPFVVDYYRRQAVERRDEAVGILAAYELTRRILGAAGD